MHEVLQAERDAERAIQACEDRARQILHDAQARAQRILARADQRITNMEMRHGHKMDRLVRAIENEGAARLSQQTGRQYDRTRLNSIIESLAAELCQPAKDRAEDP